MNPFQSAMTTGISTKADEELIDLSEDSSLKMNSYKREAGFSALVGIKSKFRNKLQFSNFLRLKLSQIEINIKSIIENSKKQAHPSHQPD